MSDTVETSKVGDVLCVYTPDQYAMNIAVKILTFLDGQPGIEVKHTGWQNGFGLDVAVWIQVISSLNFTAEITTDGEEFSIRLASGSKIEFEALSKRVIEFLEGR